MFSKVSHQEVDRKSHISKKPVEAATSKGSSTNPALFQPEHYSCNNQSNGKNHSFPDTRTYDRLLTIQKAFDIITEKLNRFEIAQRTLELCREVIQFEYGNIVLHHDGKWEAVYQKTRNDFEAIFNAFDDHDFVEWMFTNREYVTVSVRELGLDDSTMNSGSILGLPMVMGSNGLGVCLIYIGPEELSFSMADIEAIEIIVRQASLAIHNQQIHKELDRKENIISDLKRWFIGSSQAAIVGELAKGLTHEINNPLQIILGKIQVAKIEVGNHEILKLIEGQSLRIASLLRSFSDISKGRRKNSGEVIELNSLIKDTLEVVRKQIENKGIIIKYYSETETNIIRADLGSLKWLILNLVLEAKKRMPSGGELLISTNIQDNTIQIEFRDTAPKLKDIPNLNDTRYGVESTNYGEMSNLLMANEIGGTIEYMNDENLPGNRIVFTMALNTKS